MERANMAHHDPCSGEKIENSVTESEYYVWNRIRDARWFITRFPYTTIPSPFHGGPTTLG